MQLLVAIHPSIPEMSELPVEVTKRAGGWRNAFLILFVDHLSDVTVDRWFNVPARSGRIGYVCHSGWPKNQFPAYKKDFKKALDKVSSKLRKDEKINVIFFGGSAQDCYKHICEPALSAISKRFGKERLASAKTFLPLVWGRPLRKTSAKPSPRRIKSRKPKG
ncbi:MAG: hypothetical protein ABH854_02250 [Candidatus Diapherotrites archaeon]|nr:hypothetical protein [Candidatus Micrarchaeota archaeon]MBU1940055.1 hypothetical protein [Candidatus Micrarchaeota archaeon]